MGNLGFSDGGILDPDGPPPPQAEREVTNDATLDAPTWDGRGRKTTWRALRAEAQAAQPAGCTAHVYQHCDLRFDGQADRVGSPNGRWHTAIEIRDGVGRVVRRYVP